MNVGDKVKVLDSDYFGSTLGVGAVGEIIRKSTYFGEPGAKVKIEGAPAGPFDQGSWNYPEEYLEVIESV